LALLHFTLTYSIEAPTKQNVQEKKKAKENDETNKSQKSDEGKKNQKTRVKASKYRKILKNYQ